MVGHIVHAVLITGTVLMSLRKENRYSGPSKYSLAAQKKKTF